MKKKSIFDKNKVTVIDAVEYNGRYTDAATLRTRLIAAGIILFAVAVFACVPLFLL